jgi:hypothetical protein
MSIAEKMATRKMFIASVSVNNDHERRFAAELRIRRAADDTMGAAARSSDDFSRYGVKAVASMRARPYRRNALCSWITA